MSGHCSTGRYLCHITLPLTAGQSISFLSACGSPPLPRHDCSVLGAINAGVPSLAPGALTADFPVWRDVPPLPDTHASFGPAALAAFHAQPQEIP